MEKTNKDKKESNSAEEEKTKIHYTGEGFMDYKELKSIVAAYQQRHELCEDVDLMESLSGKKII